MTQINPYFSAFCLARNHSPGCRSSTREVSLRSCDGPLGHGERGLRRIWIDTTFIGIISPFIFRPLPKPWPRRGSAWDHRRCATLPNGSQPPKDRGCRNCRFHGSGIAEVPPAVFVLQSARQPSSKGRNFLRDSETAFVGRFSFCGLMVLVGAPKTHGPRQPSSKVTL